MLFLWALSALPVHSTLPSNLNLRLAQSPVLATVGNRPISDRLRIWAWAPIAGFKTAPIGPCFKQLSNQEKPQGEHSAFVTPPLSGTRLAHGDCAADGRQGLLSGPEGPEPALGTTLGRLSK